MLVLSRKVGETIHIDGGIVITIVRAYGDKVRVGIDAPRKLNIARGEFVVDTEDGSEEGDRQKT